MATLTNLYAVISQNHGYDGKHDASLSIAVKQGITAIETRMESIEAAVEYITGVKPTTINKIAKHTYLCSDEHHTMGV